MRGLRRAQRTTLPIVLMAVGIVFAWEMGMVAQTKAENHLMRL